MARKSSKTAHVMNLLAGDNTGSDQESTTTEAAKENQAARETADSPETIKELTVLAQQASIQTQEGPITPSPISIIDMTSTAPDPVAELIRQNLEEELENGGQAEGASEDIPQEEPDSQTVTQPLSQDSPSNEAMGQTLDADLETSPEVVSSYEENPPDLIENNYTYLNVMEFVVKNIAINYMKKFDVCTCGRCVADVTALALTNLPSKYIVVESSTASPLLNYYSTKFSQQAIVELTKACNTVKESPHH